MTVLGFANEIGQPKCADRCLEPLIDRALHEGSDLVLRTTRGGGCGGTCERAKYVRKRDFVRGSSELITTPRAAFSDDQTRFSQLTDDFFEVS